MITKGNNTMYYLSTRNDSLKYTASQAILKGLSDDGGLFIPNEIPKLEVSLDKLGELTYQETAYEVMKGFFDDFTKEELMNCINNAYDSKFDTEEIAPLVEADNSYYLELFHGKTIAFKDMALSILPHLMITSAKKNKSDKEIVILTATSGDTGKAALAGFAGVEGTKIIVFYPKGGVSKVQELQMVTQKESNTKVIGVNGNFDDCQSKVKELFADEELKNRMSKANTQFSSANSINIGRLVPQVAYYVYAYGKLVKEERIKPGDLVNICVPTGNFGNILAAYFAKCMGLPFDKLICASNDNKVLYDFFKSGSYDKNREFILTKSPSMDILISSNLERLIFLSAGKDAMLNKTLMNDLKAKGIYEINDNMKAFMADFIGEYATEKECLDKIHSLYEKTGYVIDTHTAVAAACYDKYKAETNDCKPVVIASTASPFKFTKSVMCALSDEYSNMNDFELFEILSTKSTVAVPNAIKDILNANIVHNTVCEIDDMKSEVEKFIGI